MLDFLFEVIGEAILEAVIGSIYKILCVSLNAFFELLYRVCSGFIELFARLNLF
jgi:hypothetical protein